MTIHPHPVSNCLSCVFLDPDSQALDGPEMYCTRHAMDIPNPENKPESCRVVHVDVTEDGDTQIFPPKPLAGKILLDTGLLFEINRKVLHPFGMALAVVEHDDGRVELSQGLIQVDDPEGILFTSEAYNEGQVKYSAFLNTIGYPLLATRAAGVGLHVQSYPDHGQPASTLETFGDDQQYKQPEASESQSDEGDAHLGPADGNDVAEGHSK